MFAEVTLDRIMEISFFRLCKGIIFHSGRTDSDYGHHDYHCATTTKLSSGNTTYVFEAVIQLGENSFFSLELTGKDSAFYTAGNGQKGFIESFWGTDLKPLYTERKDSPWQGAAGGLDYLVNTEYFKALIKKHCGLEGPEDILKEKATAIMDDFISGLTDENSSDFKKALDWWSTNGIYKTVPLHGKINGYDYDTYNKEILAFSNYWYEFTKPHADNIGYKNYALSPDVLKAFML